MKKGLKIFLVSLGSIALIGGVGATIYGTSSTVRDWVQEKIEDSKKDDEKPNSSDNTNQGSDNQSGNNNSGENTSGSNNDSGNVTPTPGPGSDTQADDENFEISISKDIIYLYDYDCAHAVSPDIAATIIGHPSDTRLFWHPLDSGHITMTKTITNSGENQTFESNFFSGEQKVRVTMVSNPDIYKDITVVFENRVTSYDMPFVYLCKPSGAHGTSVQITNTSSAAKGATYTDNDGTYMKVGSMQRASQAWYPSPAVSLEQDKIIELTASPNSIFEMKLSLSMKKSSTKPQFAESYDFTRDISKIVDTTYTTVIPEINYRLEEYGSTYNLYIAIKTPADYVNKSGYLTLTLFGQKYYSIHYNPYIPVSSVDVNS